jgi:hypothetical protein
MSANETAATKFISEWLNNTPRTENNSTVVQAISDATEKGILEEAKLLKKLRELAQPEPESQKA